MQAGVYKHYKGGFYQCLGVAEHSETKELMVVYVSLTGADLPGPRMRVRPLKEWGEFVPWGDGHQLRFEYYGNEIVKHGDVAPAPDSPPAHRVHAMGYTK